jgi:hypothetical protein
MAATVARQPAAASMMARVDRLDLLLGYLEETHRNGHGNASPPSATTASSPSTPAAAAGNHRGLVSSDDDDSAASTPRGSKTWRRPRPAKEVLEEAQTKGSLIDRIAFLEHRVLKVVGLCPLFFSFIISRRLQFIHLYLLQLLHTVYMLVLPCLLQMEEDMEITPADEQPRAMQIVSGYGHDTRKEKVQDPSSRKKKKGLKSLVKSCVRGNLKTKD